MMSSSCEKNDQGPFLSWSASAQSGEESFSTHSRSALVEAARQHIAAVWRRIRGRHQQGASGAAVQQDLVRETDIVLSAAAHVAHCWSEARHSPIKRFSLCAVGGYGRGELSPRSDLDLSLVYLGKLDDDMRRFNDVLVSLLWDIGFHPGHAVLSVDEAAALAKTDMKVYTSHAQARLLLGSSRPHATLRRELGDLSGEERAAVLADIRRRIRIEELPEAHREIFSLEPDIKENAGGLRDYHAARWTLDLVQGGLSQDDLARLNVIAQEEHLALSESLDFLWRIRNELHFHTGKPGNQLTFALQHHVARAFGYRGAPQTAMAHFMQDYYHAAQRLRRFFESVLHWCDHPVESMALDFSLSPEHPRTAYLIQNGQLWIGTAGQYWFSERPSRMMEIFWICARREIVLSHDALERIRENLSLAGPEFQKDRLVQQYFIAVCGRPEQAGPLLRQMAQCGLLGAYFPEFAAIQGVVRYADFHSYPVDEHTLRALEALGQIPALEGAVGRFLGHCLELLRNPHVPVLAILMHDWGKAVGDEHSVESAARAHGACTRIGMREEQIEKVVFLVEHHMRMSDIAFYRDTNDLDVIRDFSALMKTDGLLRALLLLTYADLSAVAPGVWTEWKGALLLKLFLKTERVLLGRSDIVSEEGYWNLPKAREVAEALPPELSDHTEAHLRAFGQGYFVAFTPKHIAQHLRCLDGAKKTGMAVHCDAHEATGMSEVVVCTKDRPGLFAMIAGSFCAHMVDITEAALFTSPEGYVVDCFTVRHALSGAALTKNQFRHVERTLREVLSKEDVVEKAVAQARHRFFAMLKPVVPVPVRIDFDNDASATDTVIDIEAGDRTGLLYDMAHALSVQSVDIQTARIVTDARQVRDAFYVRSQGKKILDDAALQEIRGVLKKAIKGTSLSHTE
jgi:[protein-PII] uridylyltransferase